MASPRSTAERRPTTPKRRAIYRFEAIQTLRYTCLQRAFVVVCPEGYATRDVGCSPAVAERFGIIDRMLARRRFLSHRG